MYYMLTGENITVQDAYRLGLVHKVVPQDEVMVTAMAIGKVIARKAPLSAQMIIEAVNEGLQTDLRSGFKVEENLWKKCGDTEDFRNAVKAFIAKAPVVFHGR